MGSHTYARRKFEGLCVICEAPAAPHTMCPMHLEAQRKKMASRTKRMRIYWRKQKLCITCGRIPVPGTKSCAACSERNAEWKAGRRKRKA